MLRPMVTIFVRCVGDKENDRKRYGSYTRRPAHRGAEWIAERIWINESDFFTLRRAVLQ